MVSVSDFTTLNQVQKTKMFDTLTNDRLKYDNNCIELKLISTELLPLGKTIVPCFILVFTGSQLTACA